MNPYTELGVPPWSSLKVIRAAYWRLVGECHPDRHGNSPEMSDRLKRLNAAYAMLKDPEVHAKTDARLRAEELVRRAPAPSPHEAALERVLANVRENQPKTWVALADAFTRGADPQVRGAAVLAGMCFDVISLIR